MIHLVEARDAISAFITLGGPVVAMILALSVVAGAVVLVKLWQFRAAGVGRHSALTAAMAAWDRGQRERAAGLAQAAPSHLGALLAESIRAAGAEGASARDRLYTRAEASLTRLEAGFRLLDTVAQVSPLLGLFGTVVGMIEAFRSMQAAGQSVDPSVLAGGIWVALVTTATGLAVAMPVTAILTWFEARMAGERRMAAIAIETALSPGGAEVLREGATQAAMPRGVAAAHG